MGAASHDPSSTAASNAVDSYRPRHPEQTVLYGVLAQHLETFLARRREDSHHVPRFVEDELRAFLECGILAYGFLRLRCDSCRRDKLVPFSCKGRGFCPSCCGRRMADRGLFLAASYFSWCRTDLR